MNVLLEIESFDIDTPPPSPVLFAEDCFDTVSTRTKASPVKRTRVMTRVRPPKRQRIEKVPDFGHEESEFVLDSFNSNDEPCLEAQVVDVDGYGAYIEAVAGEFAGYFPHSLDLFVVQGWDVKSNCTKVSLGFFFKAHENSLFSGDVLPPTTHRSRR